MSRREEREKKQDEDRLAGLDRGLEGDVDRALDGNVVAALAEVELLALDVDGTLTDGRIVYAEVAGAPVELQAFHVHDGLGLAELVRAGVAVVWITGRGCAATRRRAEELGARLVTASATKGPKDTLLVGLQSELGVGVRSTAAMGDDLPDLAMAERARVFAAPADARAEVRARADLVTRARAGQGAVRELCEAILVAKGLWGTRGSRGTGARA